MIRLTDVRKTYRSRSAQAIGLNDINLTIDQGQLVCIRGPSGCGKTTLLMTIGGMMRPTRGCVQIDDADIYGMSRSDRAQFRATKIGFVFQMFHLVPYLNVLDNVLLSTITSRSNRTAALELLERLGLPHRVLHKPSELSTGERQRAAIARAMLPRPSLILADEPTGNLDEENAAEVLRILADYRRDGGTILVVTHGSGAEQYADRVIHMREGNIQNGDGS